VALSVAILAGQIHRRDGHLHLTLGAGMIVSVRITGSAIVYGLV
jgi:hypothetical protein